MPDYNLAELAALSGLPPRTIRYYVAEGLVPSPGREGPSTRYPASTLARLRLIARLREAHQPLAEIRARLSQLDDVELATLLEAPEPEPAPTSAIDYIRSVLGTTAKTTAEEPPTFAVAGWVHASARGLTPAPGSPPASPLMRGFAAPAPAPAAAPAPPAFPAPAATPTQTTPTPVAGERSQWDRISLGDGIELHVRRPMSRRDNRLVDRLVAFARQIQREDPQ